MVLLACGLAQPAQAVPSFTIGWSVYAGWNPYYYLARSGILDYWARKYGVDIKAQRFDYAASLDAFVSKNTIGDYSNGNDAVLARNNLTLAQLPGRPILLVQKTISEYLLERAMVLNGLGGDLDRLKPINTSDSDIVGAFVGDKNNQVAVTWKPLVSALAQDPGVHELFNSSKIPGESLDRPDGSGRRFAKAITGAWYQTMAQMTSNGPMTQRALLGSAAASDDTLASYKDQLCTTYLFQSAQMATQFATNSALKQKMDLVRQFCFHHGLLGEGVHSVDDVAILYPDGTVQGNRKRIRLRINATYMKLAAQGGL